MEIGLRALKMSCIWQLEDFEKFLFCWVFRLINLAGIWNKNFKCHSLALETA